MITIKKKLVAIAAMCAVVLSMPACSEKEGSKNKNEIKTATLSSEEAQQLMEHPFEIAEYNPVTDLAPDPIEGESSQGGSSDSQSGSDTQQGGQGGQGGSQQGGQGGQQGGNQQGGQQDGQSGGGQQGGNQQGGQGGSQQGGQSGGQGSQDSKPDLGGSDGMVITPGNDNSSSEQGGLIDNGSDSNRINGTKETQQIWWMKLAGDYIFDGEYAKITFKIKDNAPAGKYPILIDHADFSNYDAVSLKVKTINGSVVVGGPAQNTSFRNDGSFEVKADDTSGNPGDKVTVSIRFNNNTGICATVLRFSYDSDVLEYVKNESGFGADFENALETQNK